MVNYYLKKRKIKWQNQKKSMEKKERSVNEVIAAAKKNDEVKRNKIEAFLHYIKLQIEKKLQSTKEWNRIGRAKNIKWKNTFSPSPLRWMRLLANTTQPNNKDSNNI